MSENDNFREEFRHELNSRWTTEQLRELIESVARERDRRYADTFDSLRREMAAGFAAAKEAVASALAAAKEAVNAAFLAAKEAITKSEIASEKRFESINEFREQLKDQQSTFVTRDLFDVHEKRLAQLERNEGRIQGGSEEQRGSRLQQNFNISTLIALIALGIVVINFLSQKH